MSLLPDAEGAQTHMDIPGVSVSTASLAAFSAYDLPSVEALVRYFHAAAGYPVKDTWLKAIKAGNYQSQPGLTHQNASKYCPVPIETLKGHMIHTCQNVQSTKPKVPKVQVTVPMHVSENNDTNPVLAENSLVNELHIHIEHRSKLYTNETGRLPVCSQSNNQYIMIAHHCNSNAILLEPFKTQADKHCLIAYNTIMQ
jgi:hypothetical protein